MLKMMLPKRRHLMLLIVGSLLVYGLAYWLTITSEAYEYGRHFVMEDQRVITVTGSQRSQRLSFLSGFESSFGDNDGEASLTVRVLGDRGTFDVPLVLKKRQGRWSIISAKAINEKGETTIVVE